MTAPSRPARTTASPICIGPIGESDQARHHWCQALDRYTDLDVPEADTVRAQLAVLDPANGDCPAG